MASIDDILGNDDTTPLPATSTEVTELSARITNALNARNAELNKLTRAFTIAQEDSDVETLRAIDAYLQGKKTRTRRPTTPSDRTSKALIIWLVCGGVLGFVVGMIVAKALNPAINKVPGLDSASGWIGLLIVLLVIGLGVFLGSVCHDKWRK